MTLLPNRRGFAMLAQHALAMSTRLGRPATLFYFDLDGFKSINGACDCHVHICEDLSASDRLHRNRQPVPDDAAILALLDDMHIRNAILVDN